MNTKNTQNTEKQVIESKNNVGMLKIGSRIDNNNGFLLTKKQYKVTILKSLQYNFVVIKVGQKTFRTDRLNIIID